MPDIFQERPRCGLRNDLRAGVFDANQVGGLGKVNFWAQKRPRIRKIFRPAMLEVIRPDGILADLAAQRLMHVRRECNGVRDMSREIRMCAFPGDPGLRAVTPRGRGPQRQCVEAPLLRGTGTEDECRVCADLGFAHIAEKLLQLPRRDVFRGIQPIILKQASSLQQ